MRKLLNLNNGLERLIIKYLMLEDSETQERLIDLWEDKYQEWLKEGVEDEYGRNYGGNPNGATEDWEIEAYEDTDNRHSFIEEQIEEMLEEWETENE